MTTATQLKRKRQRQRMDAAAFKALLASPATSTVVIPANGMFAIVTPAAHAAGIAATVTGPSDRSIGVPAMVDGQRRLIGKLEEGSEVTMAAWADLYVDTGLGRLQKICEGS